MMFGWFRADAARASCSNRASRSGSFDTSSGRTLSATSRPSLDPSPGTPLPSLPLPAARESRRARTCRPSRSPEALDNVEVGENPLIAVDVGLAVRREEKRVDDVRRLGRSDLL